MITRRALLALSLVPLIPSFGVKSQLVRGKWRNYTVKRWTRVMLCKRVDESFSALYESDSDPDEEKWIHATQVNDVPAKLEELIEW